MKNIFKNIILLATAALCSCGDFDDSDLRDRIDGYKKRIEVLQKKAETLNTQIESLSHLTNGNVITSVTQNSDGKYVITYKDDKDVEYTVVLATMEDLLDVPVLGVELDEEDNIYYWTQYVDGQSDWLRKGEGGERIPVRGNTPTLAVDADGYWTVNGEHIHDKDGKPVAANTDSSSIFKAASYEDGVFTLTLGNGQVLSLPVFNTLNLKLQTTATVTIVDAEAGYKIGYELTGEAKDKALIAIAKEAGGAKAAIDKEEQTINVAFDSEFSDTSNAHIIIMAYDLGNNVIVKPVFFTKAKDTRIFISSADELVQFATDVNAGAIPEGMQIFLTKHIDMSSVIDWAPIGNGTFSGSAFEGAAFSGTFDGQGYAVKNLKINNDAAPAQAVVGLFGILNNATVKNVVLGEGSSIDVKSTDFLSVGGIAAAAVGNTTIENCDNRAAIKVETGIKDKRIEVGGILGAAHTDATDIVVKGCRNYGAMSSANTLSTNNGANGIQLGGIVGFVNGTSSGTCYTRISNCENHGEFNVQAARTGGIAGALNYRGAISNCTNDAALANTEMTASNCRTAGIAAFMTNGSSIEGCVNNGDITFAVAGDTTHGYAAGIVGQMQMATTSVIGCENYGSIRSDIIKAAENKYIAIICSNTNKTACIIKDNKIGGKIGPYTEDETYTVTDITEENFSNYIFFHLAGADPTLENNVFAGAAPEGKGIRTVEELLAFRDAVNAGASLESWQDDNGVVNLLADLDMSGLEWTPIGNATIAPASNISTVAVTGNAFTGVFDGGGKTLKNLRLSTSTTVNDSAFGLFGVLKGAEVRNLNIGRPATARAADTGSLTVKTPATVWAGVLAGAVIDSKVVGCTSYVPIDYDSTSATSARAFVAMIGLCFSDTQSSYLDNVKNYGDITADVKGNTNNGLGTAPHIGGVCAVTSANSTNKNVNHIEYCANYGNIVSNAARTAGVIGAANSYTTLNSCFNYGSQTNSIGTTGRLGGITVILGTGCSMIDCENHGDLIATNSARIGGILSLANNEANSFSGCANYGKVISDGDRGVFWGYNTVACTWVNCIAGGYVGAYNGGNYIYDSYAETSKELYLGPQGAKKAQLSNITYQIGTSEGGDPVGPEPTLRILCIGNSFTKDAVEHLPKMIAAAGIKAVKIVHMYYGGRIIPEYYNGYATVSDYTCYTLYPDTDVWVSSKGQTLQQAVKSDKWDIVTLQEHTGNYRAWSWTDEEKNSIVGMIDYIKADQGGTKPRIEYIMSQAYFNMGKIGSGSVPYKNFTTQDEMFEVIVAQAKKVLDETEVDEIIPTGTVLQNLRTSSLDNEMDLTRDGYHMDYGISRYAAACAVFEMLVSPAFDGIKLDDNSFRYDVSDTSSTAYSTPVTDVNRLTALAAARYAIAKPFEVTDMSAAENTPSNGIIDIPFENDGNKE